jgi:hypothetical protein
VSPGGPDPDRPADEPPSLVALLTALIEDAQTLYAAETGYWRRAIGYVLARARTVALLLVLGLFLVFFTLMALVVGLLLSLSTLIGPWGATLVMILALGGATYWAVRRALRIARRTVHVLTGDEQ